MTEEKKNWSEPKQKEERQEDREGHRQTHIESRQREKENIKWREKNSYSH